MAIVQSRCPRHIIYYVLAALAALSAPALPACSESELSEPSALGREKVVARGASPGRDPSPDPRRAANPTAANPTATSTPDPAATSAADPTATHPTPEPAPGAPSEPDTSDFHLDDAEVEYEVPRRPARPRKGRPIEVMLRSSPPGAVAAVDGVTVGPTPAIWEGTADASAHEFTFVLPGYAIARYRFVPTQNGIVHGTLEAIKSEAEAGHPGETGRSPRGPAPGPAAP
jgi:hypothetical protein